ncbi:MAG TPA: TetR/AcrR family transcriptional regulator [Acidimicrobiia bacterium]|nr:TetR/AcrR family transcriptional regulator [Acidimicrobiia bacterium]
MSEASPPSRREAILAAALELFRRRGFHAVGIDEIGSAAGISGPGVYRHFRSKDSVLVALFDDISERMLEGARKIVSDGVDPVVTLEALVDLHVSFAVEERALLSVWLQDWRSLPEPDRNRIRARQIGYMEEWTRSLAEQRKELTDPEVETIAYAAFSVVNSVATHDIGLPRRDLDPMLRRLALAVLRG